MTRIEEILESVGTSRRQFLKRVIAGTTFAVPLVASFSMNRLSGGVPDAFAANQCATSNQAGGDCCQLATDVAADVALLAADVLAFTGTAQLVDLATLGNLLSAALGQMTKGVAKGGDDCIKKSKGKFKAARKAMLKVQAQLVAVGLDADFGPQTQQILLDIEALIPA